MPLEEHVAFLKQDELDTADTSAPVARFPIGRRAGAAAFAALFRHRRSRTARADDRASGAPGELANRIAHIWLPPFHSASAANLRSARKIHGTNEAGIEQRFHDLAADVQKFRARGGKIVFVRFPVSGKLKKLEDKETPRAGMWTRLLKETWAPGIYFEDYPELASFTCPEWSHLSAEDSVEFSRRLIPHLRIALEISR